jgi:hypothetical protein
MASITMISTASWTVRKSEATPASASTRMISSGPYALELMLSLLKTASALALLSRSCSSCSLEMGRPIRKVRRPRSAACQPRRSRIVFSEAISVPSSERSNSSSNGRTMRT